MTIPTLLQREIKIRAHEVNRLHELRLAHMLFLFEELANDHANTLGIGFRQLAADNKFWVLARMRFEIQQFPKWEETLQAKTWCNGVEGLFPLRNWELFYHSGQSCIKGHAHYLIVNATTRRPHRSKIEDFEGLTYGERATDESPQKLTKLPLENRMPLRSFDILPSHIDINHHVNHSNYFAWVWDALSFEFTEEYQPTEIDINFVKEIPFPSTQVTVFTNSDKTEFEIATENNTIHALLKIKWRTNK